MLTFEEVRDVLWKSLSDHDLLSRQSPPIQVYISSLSGKCKPDDGTALDLLIVHFAVAIQKKEIQDHFAHVLRSDWAGGLPC